jgi:predicted HTH domain antitoxin
MPVITKEIELTPPDVARAIRQFSTEDLAWLGELIWVEGGARIVQSLKTRRAMRAAEDKAREAATNLYLEQLAVWESAGHGDDLYDVLHETIDKFLEAHSGVRLDAALDLWRRGYVTLGKAAELAGSTLWDFKTVLRQRRIPIIVEARPAIEMDAMIATYERTSP